MPDKKLKVFVNYRRADDKIFVELLRTHFMFRYGQDNVFMDFDSLPPFTNFEAFIRQTVRDSDVITMMIGKHWTELMQEKAATGEPDYLLIELEEALKYDKVIAPICILGADMPKMPPSLAPIGMIHAEFISDGRHLMGDVNRIMDGFEAELERRGAARSVSNPTAPQQIQSAQTGDRSATLGEMLKRFAEAVKADDLPQALVWIGQLRASGQVIPARFKLDQREAELQVRLRELEDDRRRREVADFQYQFVRTMIALGDPAQEITAEVNAIWQIEPGYVPDDLRTMLSVLIPGREPPIAVLSFNLPLLEWINIPAGQVTLEDDAGTWDVEPFVIGKYPVTNAQFQAFIADGGYTNDAWWQGLAQRFTEPTEPSWTTGNHPRETVNWYEAIAFCRWLSDKLGQTVTLPTEMQWQRAAQGDDGRVYPWGSIFDKALCNTAEGGIGKTTPVDNYPQGQSPFGVFDMVGNVWEWCLNEYRNPGNADVAGEARRVVRGGSWNLNLNLARAALRHLNNPYLQLNHLGFRVVLSVP